ncbi:MAG: DUF2167 domain-containing protein [Thermodesulfobacteriota bacterium]
MSGTSARRNRPFAVTCAALGLWIAAVAVCFAQGQGPSPLKIDWLQGPAVAKLSDMAEVKLPEGFMFARADDARRLMEAIHNIPSGREVGLVTKPGDNWYAVFEFDDVGYVKDDEKANLDADAMLKAIKQGNEEGNKERQKRGWPTMTIVGWDQAPFYNAQTHNLEWAIRGESSAQPVVNFNTRILGRKGVMRVTLVTDPNRLNENLPAYRELMGNFEFKSGSRYAEFVQGDKVAQYGLTALVVGGAGVVAAKAGVFKWLWKVLLAVGIGLVALLKKWFGGRKASPQ